MKGIDYVPSHGAGGWGVARTPLDIDVLAGVERLDFADGHQALDIGFGVPPGTADLALFTGYLDSGTFTPASLALLAADTSYNLANIGIDSLWSTGLSYE